MVEKKNDTNTVPLLKQENDKQVVPYGLKVKKKTIKEHYQGQKERRLKNTNMFKQINDKNTVSWLKRNIIKIVYHGLKRKRQKDSIIVKKEKTVNCPKEKRCKESNMV